ncbi:MULTISPECIES: HNH endonuclease [Brucella]
MDCRKLLIPTEWVPQAATYIEFGQLCWRRGQVYGRAKLYSHSLNRTANYQSAGIRKGKLKKGAECPYCGKLFGPGADVPDHIYPVARGGLSVAENMAYICARFNQKKSNRTLNEYIYEYRLDMKDIHIRLRKRGKIF